MSWQRIDENTFIDDTLVTCAEYQLFIDEMLEQGKYSEPDHWTSHRFPVGQARKPILGVRLSIAVAFCKWLRDREMSEWEYRLPYKEEAHAFPMNTIGISPLGYWLDKGPQSYWGGDNLETFAWVGPIPVDARNLDISRASFSIDNRFLQSGFKQAVDDALLQEKNSPLSDDFERLQPLGDFNNLQTTLDQIISDGIRSYDIYGEYGHSDYSYDVIRIFTLQERIAGRSPAFEGIRLVKERIR